MHIKRGGCGTENVNIADVRSCVRNENSIQYFKDTSFHEAVSLHDNNHNTILPYNYKG